MRKGPEIKIFVRINKAGIILGLGIWKRNRGQE